LNKAQRRSKNHRRTERNGAGIAHAPASHLALQALRENSTAHSADLTKSSTEEK
jgi:hypothetical protein